MNIRAAGAARSWWKFLNKRASQGHEAAREKTAVWNGVKQIKTARWPVWTIWTAKIQWYNYTVETIEKEKKNIWFPLSITILVSSADMRDSLRHSITNDYKAIQFGEFEFFGFYSFTQPTGHKKWSAVLWLDNKSVIVKNES